MPCYMVVSNEPINTEDSFIGRTQDENDEINKRTQQGIEEIARNICHITENAIDTPAELIISVHTYGVQERGTRVLYADMFRFAAQDDRAIREKANHVFIGYRWSTTTPSFAPREIYKGIRNLPGLLQGVIVICLGLVTTSALAPSYQSLAGGGFLIKFLKSFTLSYAVGILLATFLALGAYLRDSYRAESSGVRDLVELLKQIDRAVVKTTADGLLPQNPTQLELAAANSDAKSYWNGPDKRVKLSFISHGIGSLIVLKVVHFFSDIFNYSSFSKRSSHQLGNIYSLNRSLLIAPDIPILELITQRENFLNTSLSRFSESYLFSNKGDIVLRIYSALANTIRFPSGIGKLLGSRLGSITLSGTEFGIVNLNDYHKGFPKECPIDEAILSTENELSGDVLDRLCLSLSRPTTGRKRLVSALQELPWLTLDVASKEIQRAEILSCPG
ncbi:MAG: hypothetical protein AAFZ17_17935 [Cyanobacteria bacterium J06650_10]